DEIEHLLRVRQELVVVRDRLRLAPDGDHRPLRAVLGEAVADLALGRRAVGALGRLRHPALAQEDDRGFHVAVRLLQGALAVHHPGARLVAELLDERRRDLRHYEGSSVGAPLASVGAAASGALSAGSSTDACASTAGAAPFS